MELPVPVFSAWSLSQGPCWVTFEDDGYAALSVSSLLSNGSPESDAFENLKNDVSFICEQPLSVMSHHVLGYCNQEYLPNILWKSQIIVTKGRRVVQICWILYRCSLYNPMYLQDEPTTCVVIFHLHRGSQFHVQIRRTVHCSYHQVEKYYMVKYGHK